MLDTTTYAGHNKDMNTTASTKTYLVDVVAMNGRWHQIAVAGVTDHTTVKAQARRIAKAQGIEVKFINSMFIAS